MLMHKPINTNKDRVQILHMKEKLLTCDIGALHNICFICLCISNLFSIPEMLYAGIVLITYSCIVTSTLIYKHLKKKEYIDRVTFLHDLNHAIFIVTYLIVSFYIIWG